MPEYTDQDIIDSVHNCRERVQNGHAKFLDVHHEVNKILEYECDVCSRHVWEICEVFNIQVAQRDHDNSYTAIMEPRGDVSLEELYTAELYKH